MRRSPKEITAAINRYARRHNMFARTVRTMTCAFNAAMIEDDVRRGIISLDDARAKYIARYPDTRRLGPNHVSHWIK